MSKYNIPIKNFEQYYSNEKEKELKNMETKNYI